MKDVKLTDKQAEQLQELVVAQKMAERDLTVAVSMLTPAGLKKGTTFNLDLAAKKIKFGEPDGVPK